MRCKRSLVTQRLEKSLFEVRVGCQVGFRAARIKHVGRAIACDVKYCELFILHALYLFIQ